MEWGNTLLDDYVLALTGVARPRICFLPTASGDADHYVVRFYRAFPANRCESSHISLFRRETGVGDPRAHLLDQDIIYVGGGSLVSLLGTWRAHGIDMYLREAWERGVILCGGSAGALCWFTDALSGFHEGPARAIKGLGLLPWSSAVHYYEEEDRRRDFIDAIDERDGPPVTEPAIRPRCTSSEPSWPRWSPRDRRRVQHTSRSAMMVWLWNESCQSAISGSRRSWTFRPRRPPSPRDRRPKTR